MVLMLEYNDLKRAACSFRRMDMLVRDPGSFLRRQQTAAVYSAAVPRMHRKEDVR